MALGAFLAGLLLSESEYRHQVEADIRPFRGIFLGLFFMTVGMSIDIAFIFSELTTIILIVVGLMAGKAIITTALCRLFGSPLGLSAQVGLLLSQGGEFGFILFLTANALGLLSTDLTQLLLASVTLTMAATPAMAYAGERFQSFWSQQDKETVAGVEQIKDGLHDHVLIAGFGRVGQTVAKILSAGDIPYIALDMDAPRIAACRSKGMPVFFGDASQVEILTAAGAQGARGAVITIDHAETADRILEALNEISPALPVVARARDLPHSRRLEKDGATQAVPETLESSLQLGAIAMSSMGGRPDEVAEIIQELRSDDYANLSETVHV